MSASAIIKEAISDGLNLALTEHGTIKVWGEKSAVHRWKPIIKLHKPEIIQALSANDAPIPDDLEHLIVRAGAFWEYSPDDYDLIRKVARRDPDGLRLALENDVAFSRPDAIAAEPLHQDAPEPARACSTCSRATYRGGCGDPVAAGLSDLPGVIRYSPDQDATCPAWLVTATMQRTTENRND